MINSTNSNRNSLNTTFCHLSKINPFNSRKTCNGQNIKSLKKKFIIPNSTREFGKEINISSILTTTTNNNGFNSRRSFGIPVKNNKKEKEEMNNKLKNIKQIADIKKKKKELYNSITHKSSSSNGKLTMNKISGEQYKKDINKGKYKNQSQKNILNTNKTNMTINMTMNTTFTEDIIMIDENTNPNIIINDIKNNVTKNNSDIFCENKNEKEKETNDITNKVEEDVVMKIENTNEDNKEINNNNKEINIIVPYNSKPQEVTEYFDDICEELSKNEEKYLVDPEYMSHQSDINHRMRAILIDWLIDVHLKYKLVPQTMYIAVNLIDRYLSKVDTHRAKLQLVGVTAMFIATKYEEIYPPELKDFVYITDGAYIKNDVLRMESKMLSKLNFDVTFPTMWNLFEIYKKKLDLDEKTFKLAWFLMELCLIDYNILQFKMSEIAASAILIASKNTSVYRNNWLKDTIGIDENDLEDCCKEIYEFYNYNATHNLQAIRRKFSSIKYGEVAKIKLC